MWKSWVSSAKRDYRLRNESPEAYSVDRLQEQDGGLWRVAARDIFLLVAAVAIGAGIVFHTLTGGATSTPAAEPTILRGSEMTVEQLYDRVEQNLAAKGVFEVSIVSDTASPVPYRRTLWIDGPRQVVREKITTPESSSESLATADQVFRHESAGGFSVAPSQFSRCHDSGIAVSMLLGCPGSPNGSTVSVEEGTLEGMDVLVLSDQGVGSSHRIFLDAVTLMPIRLEAEGTSLIGDKEVRFSGASSFTVRSVPPSSLAEDFFSATAIGFATNEAEAEVIGAAELPVFWLGREFEADGLEPLVLRSVSTEPGSGHPYRSRLTYARADSPYEAPFLILLVYTRANFVVAPEVFGNAVFQDDTVVLFREATIDGASEAILTPETLDALKQGLKPYEPLPAPAQPAAAPIAESPSP
jgi:hypothetical protein